MTDADATIQQLKDRVAAFVAAREWEKFHRPKSLSMSLAIEAAELMEHFQWLDDNQADALLAKPDARQAIADEMADILAYLLSLASAASIDLAESFLAKMDRNETKYPADEVRGRYDRPAAD